MSDLKPNYYAIIPANVRYDKELSPNAKLLYGEITALCNDKGYCWATNQYFSTLYELSDRTIRTLLKQLSDKKYIKIELKDNQSRRIYIEFTGVEKNFLPPRKKTSEGMEENFHHNNKENIKNEYLKEEEILEVIDSDWFE